MRDELRSAIRDFEYLPRLDPMSQLMRSLLGSRTKDEVSWSVFERLVRAYPRWAELAALTPDEIEALIAEVTIAEKKAGHIAGVLRTIGASHPDYDLEFLGTMPAHEALRWLRRLDGVGPKIAAATLNFSTLRKPAFVVDTHVLRILRRFGTIGLKANTERAFTTVMSAIPAWSAEDMEELHILLKRLGQTRCKHGLARCDGCPLVSLCRKAGLPPGRNPYHKASPVATNLPQRGGSRL